MTTNNFVAESIVSADSLLSAIEVNPDSDSAVSAAVDTVDSAVEFAAFDGTPNVGDTVRVKVKNAGVTEGVVDYSGDAYFQVAGWGIFADSVEFIEKAA